MPCGFAIQSVAEGMACEIAEMLGDLRSEIVAQTNTQAFNFDKAETATRLAEFLSREVYFVFVVRDSCGLAVGFVAFYESRALYAEGEFGTISELYVRPSFRSLGLGARLIDQSKKFALARGWKRLEVTTPPLPSFERTLAFYEREGFSITGGRKVRLLL